MDLNIVKDTGSEPRFPPEVLIVISLQHCGFNSEIIMEMVLQIMNCDGDNIGCKTRSVAGGLSPAPKADQSALHKAGVAHFPRLRAISSKMAY